MQKPLQFCKDLRREPLWPYFGVPLHGEKVLEGREQGGGLSRASHRQQPRTAFPCRTASAGPVTGSACGFLGSHEAGTLLTWCLMDFIFFLLQSKSLVLLDFSPSILFVLVLAVEQEQGTPPSSSITVFPGQTLLGQIWALDRFFGFSEEANKLSATVSPSLPEKPRGCQAERLSRSFSQCS